MWNLSGGGPPEPGWDPIIWFTFALVMVGIAQAWVAFELLRLGQKLDVDRRAVRLFLFPKDWAGDDFLLSNASQFAVQLKYAKLDLFRRKTKEAGHQILQVTNSVGPHSSVELDISAGLIFNDFRKAGKATLAVNDEAFDATIMINYISPEGEGTRVFHFNMNWSDIGCMYTEKHNH